ncbi:MAG: hypothetical protein V2A73_04375 [Pseudomonadota bacterium]
MANSLAHPLDPPARILHGRQRTRLVGTVGLAFVVVGVLASSRADGWDAETTHAGLTEQAALASRLHQVLTSSHGRELGLYASLALLPRDATALAERLGHIPSSIGSIRDSRGRMSAFAWLVAGSVIEDMPLGRSVLHFCHPSRNGTGTEKTRTKGNAGEATAMGCDGLGREHPSALEWIERTENDLGIGRFWLELEQAAVAATVSERDGHLARALLHAGALLHVLEDVGSPTRARGDSKAHVGWLGPGYFDRGARFERLASLTYGRLGVPATTRTGAANRIRARDFFAAPDGRGLADITATRWYSANTLPRSLRIPRRLVRGELRELFAAAQPLPLPIPATDIGLDELESSAPGGIARDSAGVCLANYRRTAGGKLEWSISDDCAVAQLASILPEIGSYAAAFLDWLFRGTLDVEPDGTVLAAGFAAGKGTISLLSEDAAGNRRPVATVQTGGCLKGERIASFGAAVPAEATRLVAVFNGVDAVGEQVVAVGSVVAVEK